MKNKLEKRKLETAILKQREIATMIQEEYQEENKKQKNQLEKLQEQFQKIKKENEDLKIRLEENNSLFSKLNDITKYRKVKVKVKGDNSFFST